MLRYVVLFLLILIMLPVLRGWLGALAKLLLNWAIGPANSAPGGQRSPMAPPPAPAGSTMLHKDPVCGTYVSEAVAVTAKDGSQTLYFCSQACRDKYRGRG